MTREEYGHRAKVEGTGDKVQPENYSLSHTFLTLLGQLAVGGGSLSKHTKNQQTCRLEIVLSRSLLNCQLFAIRKFSL